MPVVAASHLIECMNNQQPLCKCPSIVAILNWWGKWTLVERLLLRIQSSHELLRIIVEEYGSEAVAITLDPSGLDYRTYGLSFKDCTRSHHHFCTNIQFFFLLEVQLQASVFYNFTGKFCMGVRTSLSPLPHPPLLPVCEHGYHLNDAAVWAHIINMVM